MASKKNKNKRKKKRTVKGGDPWRTPTQTSGKIGSVAQPLRKDNTQNKPQTPKNNKS